MLPNLTQNSTIHLATFNITIVSLTPKSQCTNCTDVSCELLEQMHQPYVWDFVCLCVSVVAEPMNEKEVTFMKPFHSLETIGNVFLTFKHSQVLQVHFCISVYLHWRKSIC